MAGSRSSTWMSQTVESLSSSDQRTIQCTVSTLVRRTKGALQWLMEQILSLTTSTWKAMPIWCISSSWTRQVRKDSEWPTLVITSGRMRMHRALSRQVAFQWSSQSGTVFWWWRISGGKIMKAAKVRILCSTTTQLSSATTSSSTKLMVLRSRTITWLSSRRQQGTQCHSSKTSHVLLDELERLRHKQIWNGLCPFYTEILS